MTAANSGAEHQNERNRNAPWDKAFLTVMADSAKFDKVIARMADEFSTREVTAVAGLEFKGVPLAAALARKLNVGLLLLRKCRNEDYSNIALPSDEAKCQKCGGWGTGERRQFCPSVEEDYAVQEIQGASDEEDRRCPACDRIAPRAFKVLKSSVSAGLNSERVLVVDDMYSTGGSMKAALKLLRGPGRGNFGRCNCGGLAGRSASTCAERKCIRARSLPSKTFRSW